MTNGELELSQAVLDCLAGAAQVRSALVSKIASLQEDNNRLRQGAVRGGVVKQLVGALTESGIIDRFNGAYFQKCACDENAASVLARLLSILPKEGAKVASTPASPFKVDTGATNVRAENSSEATLSRRLAELAKRS